jgi:dolichol kinase
MTVHDEIVRKSIHLCMFVIPVGYIYVSKPMMIVVLGMSMVLALSVELIRFKSASLSIWFNHAVGRLLRAHERSGLTGSTYLIIGAFLTVLLFEKWIALIALLFLIVSDAFGALVGKLWGRYILYKNKTLEGCGIFFITAFSILFLFPNRPFMIGLIGVLTALMVDIFIDQIDDNLTIPLCSGIAMQVSYWIFG